MNLSVVFKTLMNVEKERDTCRKPGEMTKIQADEAHYLRVVEDAAAIIGTDDCVLPVLAEISCSDEACLAIHLIPQSNLLVWDIPES